MAISTRPQGARGAMRVFCCNQEGGNLSNCERGLRYSVVPNKGKPMTKQVIRSRDNLHKGM
jgi:hypothetical protein